MNELRDLKADLVLSSATQLLLPLVLRRSVTRFLRLTSLLLGGGNVNLRSSNTITCAWADSMLRTFLAEHM